VLAAEEGAQDLVVVLPGILGSTLAKDGKLVWAPSAGSVLQAIGLLGATTLHESDDQAAALFNLAIGQALDPDHIGDTAITEAANLAPGKVTSWLPLLVELAARHPGRSAQLTQLATALTQHPRLTEL
jgi:hypothetical protein